MRKLLVLLTLLISYSSFSQPCTGSSTSVWPSKCFEIVSILVDACDGGNEGQNEMVRLQIGPSPLLISGFSIPAYGGSGFVNWGTGATNLWRGFANYNATTLGKINTINNSISSSGHCGVLIPLNNNQSVPAHSNLLIITSTNFNPSAQSFDNLMDTLYVVMQTNGNTAGHFANNSGGAPYARKLIINHTLCSDTVTYQKDELLKQDLTNGAEDGGTVNFTFSGLDTYVNYGCAVPITPVTFDAGTVAGPFCSGTQVQLNAAVSGTNCYVWQMKDTTQGTFSDSTILNPKFQIKSGLSATSIVLYFALKYNCSLAKDSVIINVSNGTLNLFAGNDTTVCMGNLVPIKATSNDAGTLLWSTTGTGTFANSGSLQTVYTPASSEQGIVYLRIQQQTTCGNYADSLMLTINPLPNPNFATPSGTLCAGASPVTLIPITAGGVFSGNGISGGNQFTPSASGLFPIKYVITIAGCSDSFMQNIIVVATPNPNFSLSSTSICLGADPITLTPITVGGIFKGTGITGNQFQATTSGLFTIKYIIISGGCSDSSEQSITVNPLPNAQFTPSVTRVCEGAPLIGLSPITAGGMFVGSSFINGNNFDPQMPGSYTLKYIVTENSCIDSSDQTIIVDAKPNPSFTMSDTLFCIGDASELLVPQVAGGVFTGLHVLGNRFEPTSAGKFVIQHTLSNGTCADSSTKEVQVNDNPIANFSMNPNPGQINEPVQFTYTGTSVNSYDWNFGNPILGSSIIENPIFSFPQESKYEVSLIVDHQGCFDTLTQFIDIKGADTIILPNVFTPNGDGINDFFRPNQIGIDTYQIQIYNRWGGQVFESNSLNNNWDGTYNSEPCIIGVYFYLISARSFSGRAYNLHGTITLLR